MRHTSAYVVHKPHSLTLVMTSRKSSDPHETKTASAPFTPCRFDIDDSISRISGWIKNNTELQTQLETDQHYTSIVSAFNAMHHNLNSLFQEEDE